jgi:formate hydrogenlyase subunit 3/multisubunit Na+/H+ antiporter MnhD subunit
LFAVPALSLSGVPPFSGFVAKLALVDAGIDGVIVNLPSSVPGSISAVGAALRDVLGT